MADILQDNSRIRLLVDNYMKTQADFIDGGMMEDMLSLRLPVREAYCLLLSVAMGLDIDENPDDRLLYYSYFPWMVHCIPSAGTETVPAPASRSVKAYEAFPYGEDLSLPDGRIIPQLAFCQKECRISEPEVVLP